MEDDDEIPNLVEIDVISKRIPVSILTGFLGSGKTTLLNYLLRHQHGKRIAIIENEFSSGLGIENMIAKSGINGQDIAGFFELSNGCICCSVKDDLLATLEQLVLHKDRFDYVLIETTGVANPGPIIASLWADEGADSTLKLDGVVTVVDCVNIIQYLNSSDTSDDVRVQIALADRILLNKIDLISSESQLQEIESTIKLINSSAELIRTSFSNVDPSWVLDINSYSLKNIEPFLISNTITTTEQTSSNSHDCQDPLCTEHHEHNHNHKHNDEDNHNHQQKKQKKPHIANTLTTHGFSFTGFVNINQLKLLLDQLLYSFTNDIPTHNNNNSNNNSDDINNKTTISSYGRIYRMKGIFHVLDDDYLYIMQAVHDVFDIQPSTFQRNTNDDPTNGQNSVIIIGKNIDKEYLENKIKNCIN